MTRFPILLPGLCVSASLFGCGLIADYTPPSAGTGGSSGNATAGGSGGSGAMGGDSVGPGGQAGGGGEAGAGGFGSGGAGGMAWAGFCDSADPTLLACFRFNGGFNDESGKFNMVSAKNVSLVGGVEGGAVNFQINNVPSLIIQHAPHWNVTDFSIELWYKARSPMTTRMGLFDSQDRYGLFFYPGEELRCIGGGGSGIGVSGFPLNTWTHAACVQSGDMLRLYVNGTPIATVNGAVAPPVGTGVNAIGSDAPSGDIFDGLIDNVRIWNTARTDAQICMAAGKQGC
jgi:hypothetical protein